MLPFIIDADNAKTKNPPQGDSQTLALNYLEGEDADGRYLEQSFWQLSDKELEEIVKTKTIVLNLYGTRYPPISIHVLEEKGSSGIDEFLKPMNL